MKIEELNVDEKIGRVRHALSRHDREKGILIPTLHRIQEDHGYLPEDVLRNLSKKLNLPLAEIYSVASFYKQFHFTPRGKKVVKVCVGTACYVRGAQKVLEGLKEEFKIKEGETTGDLSLTLETVGCVGCCGLAPVAAVNEDVIGDIGPKKLNELIKEIRKD
jgi:NADH-quinone oxidoreductase subunit E